jgi:hypothetical protein
MLFIFIIDYNFISDLRCLQGRKFIVPSGVVDFSKKLLFQI